MIYKKDGKILVKDGKLCSTCCTDCPGSVTIEFAGVTECENPGWGTWDSWPSELNGVEFIVPLTGYSAPYKCRYSLTQDGWTITLDRLVASPTLMTINACFSGTFDCEEGSHIKGCAFSANNDSWDTPAVEDNDLLIGHCGCNVPGDTVAGTGWGGTVTWSKN